MTTCPKYGYREPPGRRIVYYTGSKIIFTIKSYALFRSSINQVSIRIEASSGGGRRE